MVSENGTVFNPLLFTGREYDAESGLYYYRARYYDSSIGRFLSEDLIGFNGGINIYTYVGNNPASFVDPLGLQEMFPLDPNIPFPYLPIPDSGGCFGSIVHFAFSWDSSKPDVTSFGISGATLGGGLTFCYEIQCDNCMSGPPGGSAGPPSFGIANTPNFVIDAFKKGTFSRGFGFAVTRTGDSVCITMGIFGGVGSPFFIGAPLLDF
ncbi:MAG: RHS repeat-associated core domain-containing protein [Candidatus Dadabacteria bacterium]|nr:RHS repeat-associated core domain-containing protein [Candidatus Dadabacteria bacterium]